MIVAGHLLHTAERLGQRARQFRGTRCEDERQKIAAEYAAAVERFITSGN